MCAYPSNQGSEIIINIVHGIPVVLGVNGLSADDYIFSFSESIRRIYAKEILH